MANYYYRFCAPPQPVQSPWLTPVGKEVKFEIEVVARQPGLPATLVGKLSFPWPRRSPRRVVKGARENQAARNAKA